MQEIHLKKRCTGTPESIVMPYCMPSIVAPILDFRGCKNYQYNTIVLIKVQLAKQHKTAKKIAKTWPLELYEIASSQGTTPSPSMCNVRRRDEDWNHHEMGHASRVSKENEVGEESNEY